MSRKSAPSPNSLVPTSVNEDFIQEFEKVIQKNLSEYHASIESRWWTTIQRLPLPMECALSREYAAGYAFAREQIMATLDVNTEFKKYKDKITQKHADHIRSALCRQESLDLD